VLGSDVAGEVVEVGSAVTRFRTGDRVLGHAVGNRQEPEHLSSPTPDDLSYQQAAVLPLGLSTAACGLFQRDLLGLRLPTCHPQPTGQTVLVWGGSTSVGSNAIQLAAAAGYDVLTTASAHNHDYVKRLGASQAFDYRSPTAVGDITRALRGRTLAGTIAIGHRINKALPGHRARRQRQQVPRHRLHRRLLPAPRRHPPAHPAPGRLLSRVLRTTAALQMQSCACSIRTTAIWGSTLTDNEVGPRSPRRRHRTRPGAARARHAHPGCLREKARRHALTPIALPPQHEGRHPAMHYPRN